MKLLFEEFLKSHKINAEVMSVEENAYIDKIYVKLNGKSKVSTIESLSVEIGLALSAIGPAIVSPDFDLGTVCVEVPKKAPATVMFSVVEESSHMSDSMTLPVVVGMTPSGEVIYEDLFKAPHMLVAGASGSGKSVFLHSLINSVLTLAHNKTDLWLFDPKQVEFSNYKTSPHVRRYLGLDFENYQPALEELVKEMNLRYELLSKKNVRSITEYNKKSIKMNHIICVIDEFGDIVSNLDKSFKKSVVQLLQKSRAVGIHIVAATQNPSKEIITGDMKANFMTKVVFKVSTHTQSVMMIGTSGAERLLGKGDGLVVSSTQNLTRFKGVWSEPTTVYKPRWWSGLVQGTLSYLRKFKFFSIGKPDNSNVLRALPPANQ